MQQKKGFKGCKKIDRGIGNTSLVNERCFQDSDNIREEAVLETGGTCFQAFVSSAQREKRE